MPSGTSTKSSACLSSNMINHFAQYTWEATPQTRSNNGLNTQVSRQTLVGRTIVTGWNLSLWPSLNFTANHFHTNTTNVELIDHNTNMNQ